VKNKRRYCRKNSSENQSYRSNQSGLRRPLQEGNRHTITCNSQYDPIKPDLKTAETIAKNAINNYINDQKGWTKVNKEGPQDGGLYFELLQDGTKAISNFLLEGQAEDVIEAMKKKEAEARAKINVIDSKY